MALAWRAHKNGISRLLTYFILEFWEMFKHETLAQTKKKRYNIVMWIYNITTVEGNIKSPLINMF